MKDSWVETTDSDVGIGVLKAVLSAIILSGAGANRWFINVDRAIKVSEKIIDKCIGGEDERD